MLKIRSSLCRNFFFLRRQTFSDQNKPNDNQDNNQSNLKLMLNRAKDANTYHKGKPYHPSSPKKMLLKDKFLPNRNLPHDKPRDYHKQEQLNPHKGEFKPKPFLKNYWERQQDFMETRHSKLKGQNKDNDSSKKGVQSYDFSFADNKLPHQMEKKWEDFFYRSTTKVFLTLDRAINNMPDAIYLEFVNDSLQFLNEHQLTFVLKNLFLHRRVNVEFDTEDLLETLRVRITQMKNLNFNSKDLILSLMEVIHLFPQPKTRKAVEIFESIVDNMRLLAEHFTNEQFLFILKVCLENDFYDLYMIQMFKQRFKTDLEFISLITHNLNYNFRYFKYPVKVNDAVLKIVEAYLDMCYLRLNTKPEEDKFFLFDKPKFPQIIVQMLENFFEGVLQGTIDLDQIASINFSLITSIFDIDTAQKWERALNNLIMTHVSRVIEPYQNNLFDNPIAPGLVIKIVEIMKKFNKDAYSHEQFEDLFNKMCHFAMLSNNNLQNNDYIPNNQNLKMISNTFKLIITSLLDIAVKNNIFNPYIISPFLNILRKELNTLTKQGEKGFNLFEMLKLFGRYNFDSILKKYDYDHKTMDDYFTILLNLEKVLTLSLTNFSPPLPNGKQTSSLLVNEKNNFKICKTFFSTLEEENKYIVTNNDVTIPKLSGMHLIKFNSFPKNILIYYYLSKYNLIPSVKVTDDLKIESIANDFEIILDSFITAVNYKAVTTSHVEIFLEIIERLYNTKNKDINLFDYFLKEVLLRNKDFYEKLVHVINFILNPENYYSLSSNARMSINEMQELMRKEFSIDNYTKREKFLEQSNEEINKKKNLFKEQMENLSNESKTIIDYVNNHLYMERDVLDKFTVSEYESTHSKFLLRDHSSLYYNPNQISLASHNGKIISSEKYPKLIKLIMDISKISTSIDKYILSRNFSEISSEGNNFYLNSKRIFNVETLLDRTIKFTEDIRNFSEITLEEIYNSPLFYQMLKNYLTALNISGKIKFDFKKLNLKFENVIKFYPLTPYVVNYALTTDNQIQWLSVINTKYSQTDIQSLEFKNEVSFLKSHVNNILILN